jgi:hypothetical protein
MQASSLARFEDVHRCAIGHNRLWRATLQHSPEDAILDVIIGQMSSCSSFCLDKTTECYPESLSTGRRYECQHNQNGQHKTRYQRENRVRRVHVKVIVDRSLGVH